MHIYNFTNKRNKEGRLISYEGYKLNYELTDKLYNSFKNYDCIKKIKNSIDSDVIDFYFKKKIFWQLKKITDQFIIYEYEKNKDIFSPLIFNNNDFFNYTLPEELIQKIYKKDTLIKKKILNNNLLKKLKKKIKIIFNEIITFFNHENKTYFSAINLAIKYDEGIDKDYRNDFFWQEDSIIPLKNIFLYFESESLYNHFLQKKELSNDLIKDGLNVIKMWKLKKYTKNNYYNNLNFNSPTDNNEKWLLDEIKNLIKEVNFYYFFFKKYNIKIHFDPSESNHSVISKQIAVNNLNAISFGRLRTYPNNFPGYFYRFYFNDIFFVWGKDSIKRITNDNLISNFVITGNPYGGPSKNKINELELILKKFKKNNVSKVILIVDTNYSTQPLEQGIYFDDYLNFFEEIYKLLDFKSVGIIIKPKRPQQFCKTKIFNKFSNHNRCVVVTEKQTKSSDYATISNFVIGIQPQISSAFFESVSVCKRGVFYDYANLGDYEKDIYSLKNNLYFNNLIYLIKDVHKFIKNENSEDIGNWEEYLYLIDTYQDFNGPKRVAEYLNTIFECYKKNLDKKSIIDNANKIYSKKNNII